MTARDALVYADANHGSCTVVKKGLVRGGMITFTCACKTKYTIGATKAITNALRNVPEDVQL